ncbi:uncharacterized protein Z519_04353 [Cladophialophora bantiana CBS 173.52]|uniref:Thioesterase domain-containing protein n=1 Tax=Cladophialophora bantiana (strain ATCC 10958 / CBS 173.52 / CDC B-1940 / NIH 8579) TaxID=1442370 RepID=A0A0D2G6Y5_CLAB1|nr:uncharacterized protein Z519_04353 [Cladophialophora bantiana CBS 173.52]KIW94377.1 hypothetical protein Z519_04353 [Cladophialophora bantiana CBS 173.52]
MESNFHRDFDLPWCKNLLRSDISIVEVPFQHPLRNDTPLNKGVSNTMFRQTLYSPDAIRAQINFKRPTAEADSIIPWEYCYLLSLGSGIDGKAGRAHGGFNALILDQITGTVASMVSGSFAPATATMTVDYKAPIDTPGVVLCRSWAVERQGRKTWVKARIEDGRGKLLASAKSLFVDPRPEKI